MEILGGVLIGCQLIFTIVAGLYFYTCLKTQQNSKQAIHVDVKKEISKLTKLRAIRLTEPLSEKTRPEKLSEIIGQEKGIKALKAALCGPNPQHVIIYGPPGIGKTAAARIVLEEAKLNSKSPFRRSAKFVEMDATILQFDERSVADPLIGSVHDPIYQGAGAYGLAGIPQPKPGAVTKAHGGVLFLDEIGELHPYQMNKLLKVLEDRKVFLNSSYYSEGDSNIPKHIHDIFENGLPADFRLIGATTRSPESIPSALRSRCTEIYFRSLNEDEVEIIADNACKKAGMTCEVNVPEVVSKYSSNGRDTVNIIQTATSLATLESRKKITEEDIFEVVDYGRYSPRVDKKVRLDKRVGVVNGLAVSGSMGFLLELEVVANKGNGEVKVTGIVEEEELSSGSGKMKRRSTARASVDNVLTVLASKNIDVSGYDIHVNFPGGMPVDGPSAGIAIFCGIYSAITGEAIDSKVAMTGEIGIHGQVLPVGGVGDKTEAAFRAGATRVIMPKDNYQAIYDKMGVEIISVKDIDEVIELLFDDDNSKKDDDVLTA